MRKSLSIAGLLLAWLCANGALLDCAQLLAWTQMVQDNTRIMPLAQAIVKTFDGSAPCEICSTVDELRPRDSSQPLERSAEKLVLALEPAPALFAHVSRPAWPVALALAAPVRIEPVPVPPPRA